MSLNTPLPSPVEMSREHSAEALTGAFFPGADSQNGVRLREQMSAMLDHWFQWRDHRFSAPASENHERLTSQHDLRLVERLNALQEALTEETPTFTPRYLAHMKADLSLPAILGWFAAMLHNPNTTSPEASRVGSRIEREAIRHLGEMMGFGAQVEGHFTSGGTIANFEAVWRARYRMDRWLALALCISQQTGASLDFFDAAHMGWPRFRDLSDRYDINEEAIDAASALASNPCDIIRRLSIASGQPYRGPVLLVPGNRHYSWEKAADVFGLGREAVWSVELDEGGRMDIDKFIQTIQRAHLERRPILAAVAVAGTTETGALDPIDAIFDHLDALTETRGWSIWRHVDAAYGGFFRTLVHRPGDEGIGARARSSLEAIKRADSITIDPHKLGYVPYACGAFLTADAQRYAVSSFDAPYLDRPELGPGKWASTLEGSRSAAGAAATWLTAETLGFDENGLGSLLKGALDATAFLRALILRVAPAARFVPADSNILCFSIAREGDALSESNRLTEAVFRHFQSSPGFSVSKTTFAAGWEALRTEHVKGYKGHLDADEMLVIRCVVMNPYWCQPSVRDRVGGLFADELRAAVEGALNDGSGSPQC